MKFSDFLVNFEICACCCPFLLHGERENWKEYFEASEGVGLTGASGGLSLSALFCFFIPVLLVSPVSTVPGS